MNLQTLSWRALPWVKATRPQWRYALRNGIAMCLALSIAYALDLCQPFRRFITIPALLVGQHHLHHVIAQFAKVGDQRR